MANKKAMTKAVKKRYRDEVHTPSELILHAILQPRIFGTNQFGVYSLESAYANGNDVPPMRVAKINNRGLYLIDGWHRYAALERLGLLNDRVGMRVCTVRTLEEARREAVLNNANPGRPLSRQDKQAQFDQIIKERLYLRSNGQPMSARMLETKLGVYKKSHWSRKMAALNIELPSEQTVSEYEQWCTEQEAEREAAISPDSLEALTAFLEALNAASLVAPNVADEDHLETALQRLSNLQTQLQVPESPTYGCLDI